MKTKIFSLVAIVIALASVAFTTPDTSKLVDDVYFEFNPSLTPDETNVENPANWIQTANAGNCDGQNQQACVIGVPNAMANTGSPRTLKSSVNIVATEYLATNIFYVSSLPAGANRYNKHQ